MAGTGISPEDFEFSIFDRWGTLIFKTNDLQKGWDGTSRGKPVPNDVYVYKINFKMKENKEFISKVGHVSLLR
jgi:gliding motility-associated-like protein